MPRASVHAIFSPVRDEDQRFFPSLSLSRHLHHLLDNNYLSRLRPRARPCLALARGLGAVPSPYRGLLPPGQCRLLLATLKHLSGCGCRAISSVSSRTITGVASWCCPCSAGWTPGYFSSSWAFHTWSSEGCTVVVPGLPLE